MVLVRLLIILLALLAIVCTALYLFTGNRSYLTFLWRSLRITGYTLLILVLLFVIERYLLSSMAWL